MALLAREELGQFGIEEFDTAEQAIIEIGSRHPLRLEQAREIEQCFNAQGTVDNMLSSKQLFTADYRNTTYVLPAHFRRQKLW